MGDALLLDRNQHPPALGAFAKVDYAAIAVHRLAQLGDLKLSFNVEAEPRAAHHA